MRTRRDVNAGIARAERAVAVHRARLASVETAMTFEDAASLLDVFEGALQCMKASRELLVDLRASTYRHPVAKP